jgi:putative ubiquitin-RnfH superfamily antitoxin RatB of RatAB toxin-antitoxin module
MSIDIILSWSPAPREVFGQALQLPEGATVQDAVAASELPKLFPVMDWSALTPGIWGRATDWSVALRQGDRIELCRPLKVDPKVARRERFKRQGARTTGLFASRRDGGKPDPNP